MVIKERSFSLQFTTPFSTILNTTSQYGLPVRLTYLNDPNLEDGISAFAKKTKINIHDRNLSRQ